MADTWEVPGYPVGATDFDALFSDAFGPMSYIPSLTGGAGGDAVARSGATVTLSSPFIIGASGSAWERALPWVVLGVALWALVKKSK